MSLISFDSKVTIELYASNIINNASDKLEFIKRICKDFHNAHSHK